MKFTLALLALAASSAAARTRFRKDAVERLASRFPQAPVVQPLREARATDGAKVPVVLMHGLGDAGSNPGMQSLATSISAAYPGTYAVAVDVADGFFSFITAMETQVDQFAQVVQADPNLKNGFSAVGLSQGGLVVRGYIEKYNNPPVHSFVSICGVQGGEYNCPLEIDILPFVCSIFESNPYDFLFNGSIPLSFSDYWVTYDDEAEYLARNTFLPVYNNQVPHPNNATFEANWKSLAKVALVAGTQDTVVYPWQSEQFGGYAWNSSASNGTVYTFTESVFYTGNVLGMRDQYEAGVIDFLQFDGDHLRFNQSFWDEEILPYFNVSIAALAA